MKRHSRLCFILSISYSIVGCYHSSQNLETKDAEIGEAEDADTLDATRSQQENIVENDGSEASMSLDAAADNDQYPGTDELWQDRCSGPTNDGTITGTLMDFIPIPASGITIEVLNNDTGESLGISTVSDSEGKFTLEGISHDRVCLLALNVESDILRDRRIDTYNFGIPSGSKDIEIQSMMEAGAFVIMGPSANTDSVSMVYGHIYYYDQNCKLVPVNCATVEVDKPVELFYSDDMMISFSPERETSTSETGTFVFSGGDAMEDPTTQVTALVDDQPIGHVSFPWILPQRSKSLPTFHFINIYADRIGDPTPDCLR